MHMLRSIALAACIALSAAAYVTREVFLTPIVEAVFWLFPSIGLLFSPTASESIALDAATHASFSIMDVDKAKALAFLDRARRHSRWSAGGFALNSSTLAVA